MYGRPVSESIRATLKAAGVRRTVARENVLDSVLAAETPLTHAQLASLPRLRGVDPVTLYRTLGALVEARLVHRVFGVDGTWRYGAQPRGQTGCPGNHAHFLCTSCRGMWCLVGQPIPRVKVPRGARVDDRNLTASGICPRCRREKEVRGVPAGDRVAGRAPVPRRDQPVPDARLCGCWLPRAWDPR